MRPEEDHTQEIEMSLSPGVVNIDYGLHSPYTPDFPEHPLLHSSSSTLREEATPTSSIHPKLSAQLLLPGGAADGHIQPQSQPKPVRRHPFASGFEAPDWWQAIRHCVLCVVAYPALMAFTIIADGRPLFWSRTAVGLGCGVVGLVLGMSVLDLGRKFLESATWATVIHQSHIPHAPGVKLRDLATSSGDPHSSWAALQLLWNRFIYQGTSRSHREHYDRRPWSLCILFFLLLLLIAGSLPFALGRLVYIDVRVVHQRTRYFEVAISGDVSDADIANAAALNSALRKYKFSWTVVPCGDHGGLPPPVSFKWNNDTVHFSETTLSQLLPNGTGFGTFRNDTTMLSTQLTGDELLDKITSTSDALDMMASSTSLRFPRWGTRLHCAKIPDGQTQIIPRSPSGSLLFWPTDVIHSLFSSFNMEYTLPPFNVSEIISPPDSPPPGINLSEIALGARFLNTGATQMFHSTPVPRGSQSGEGWATIEQVLVQLNTSYAANGKFPHYEIHPEAPDMDGNPTSIGFDAVVCLQLFEPWILEVYNTTDGLPRSARLVGPGSTLHDVNTEKIHEKMIRPPLADPNVSRQLDSSKLSDVFTFAHQNSINQMLKDNTRDDSYQPTPSLISFTNGSGLFGYTELSEHFFADARGKGEAGSSLPYFVGSGQSVARLYPDRVLSSTSFNPLYLSGFLFCVLILGMLAAFFVPKLPLDFPHRGFEVYSWLAAFQADELVGSERYDTGIARNMELSDIQDRLGGRKFRYVNNG